ncbi:hypothetical protein CM49_04172 [Paenibacillus sp. P1XP2]|nr:hypothetical protein CM49_04172 [Paenibacillus sp. P1XP2]
MRKTFTAVLLFSLMASLIGCSGGGTADKSGGTASTRNRRSRKLPAIKAAITRSRSSSASLGGAASPGTITP